MQIATSCSSRRRKGVKLQTSLAVDLEQKTPPLDALNGAYLATCEHVRKETSSGAEEEHIAIDC